MDDFPAASVTKPLQPSAPSIVLALDPGRDKCGVAIVSREGEIHFHQVVFVAQMRATLDDLQRNWRFTHLVLGNSTSSRAWQSKIQEWLPTITVVLQEEGGSTLEARPLYWQNNPPRGWRRFVPLSLQTPPEPIDDWAAVVLARRFFAGFS